MTTAVVLGLVILFVVVFYKELLVTSFDATYAKTYGLNVQVVHYALMLVLTLVTVSALQTVGIILVVAMLILSAAVGVVSSMTGLFFSYTFNWASGPAIVIVAAGLFALSFIFSPKQNFFKLQRSVAQ